MMHDALEIKRLYAFWSINIWVFYVNIIIGNANTTFVMNIIISIVITVVIIMIIMAIIILSSLSLALLLRVW